jgi:hypothetical protein
MRHDPITCTACVKHTATNERGYTAAAIKLCPVGRAESDQALADARAGNPEIAALHRMVGLA